MNAILFGPAHETIMILPKIPISGYSSLVQRSLFKQLFFTTYFNNFWHKNLSPESYPDLESTSPVQKAESMTLFLF